MPPPAAPADHPPAGPPVADAAAVTLPAPEPQQHELHSLAMARVDQTVLRPAHVVDHGTDIVSVVRLFSQHRCTSVLVRPAPAVAGDTDGTAAVAPNRAQAPVRPQDLGVFTTAGLQRAILSGRALDQLSVGELASRPLVTIGPAQPLYEALAAMIRHRVQRLVVVDGTQRAEHGGQVLGLLEQVDLLSFLSNHSYLITRQILEAPDLAALRPAATQIVKVIALLHQGGTRIELVARLAQALSASLFERAWQLVAPPALVANSCLFVMGSEGRGEQLLKTDQDNGLVLRDGFDPPGDLAQICARFSQALADFGYPPCPGQIMLSNPQWRMPVAEFGETVRRWLLMPSTDGLMSLAIFMDAHAVAGDADLLAQVRAEVFALALDNDALLARFAAAANQFENSLTTPWWRRLLGQGAGPVLLDLKKAGTFPLVHGVRSLALAHQIDATSTADRVQALVACGALEAATGTDLVDSLHFFMGLKLKLGLSALQAGQQPGGPVQPEQLSHLDRDLLRDTLGVVHGFQQLLHRRFHLEAL